MPNYKSNTLIKSPLSHQHFKQKRLSSSAVKSWSCWKMIAGTYRLMGYKTMKYHLFELRHFRNIKISMLAKFVFGNTMLKQTATYTMEVHNQCAPQPHTHNWKLLEPPLMLTTCIRWDGKTFTTTKFATTWHLWSQFKVQKEPFISKWTCH